MEGYLTYYYEYHFLYITGIDHVESKSIQGAALMKLVFHEGTEHGISHGGDDWLCQSRASLYAAGTVPPFVTRFDAGSVAVGQLVLAARRIPKPNYKTLLSTVFALCLRLCLVYRPLPRSVEISGRS